jgi:ABC-type multidrug transport system ATPase subunit/ABC-type multidrug transport system permease subunit
LTVRETLLLAARLRLPRRVSWEAKQARVDSLIAQLGLARVQHTRVGGGRVRGISGGERKRLAVACELVVQPSVLLADEPTSGLDSFAALRVVQALKDASRQGRTVVASLHQPRHAIFELLDDVLLLAEGGLMLYCGPARDARGHFEALGIEFPANANPAEVLSDLAAIDHSSPEGESASRARVHRLADAWSARGGSAEAAAVAAGRALAAMAARAPKRNHERLPLWRQFTLLMGRSWKQVMRDGSTLKARLMSALSSAAVFAAIYHKLGRSQAAIQSRLGLLQVVAVNAAMSSMVKTLQLFPVERQIVNRERATGAYSVGPYLLSKLLAELPSALFPSLFGAVVYNSCGLQDGLRSPRFQKFLGVVVLESFTASALGMTVSALVPSAQAALAVGPAIMVPFIVFGGQYVNEETVPQALRWLPKASLIKHAFEAMSVLEFEDLSFEASQPGDAATGLQVLRRCGFQDSSLEQSLSRQVGVLLANWGLTYTLLRARKPRYAVLEAA